MHTRRIWGGALLALGLLAGVGVAEGQTLGTLQWQLAPFDEVVTPTVVQQGAAFVLSGFVDAADGTRAAAYGTAFLKADGTVGLGFTTVFSGVGVTTDVALSLATLNGTWRDDAGNAGTFVRR